MSRTPTQTAWKTALHAKLQHEFPALRYHTCTKIVEFVWDNDDWYDNNLDQIIERIRKASSNAYVSCTLPSHNGLALHAEINGMDMCSVPTFPKTWV